MKYMNQKDAYCLLHVAPLAGVWIEISDPDIPDRCTDVAPLAGVWIEILENYIANIEEGVAPHAGVWIEICILYHTEGCQCASLPSWECGLKSKTRLGMGRLLESCSPRGSVD